ncbi:pitrilysin family protein [Ruminococcus sp. HUN007]|uniref:EF-P 5-aminopentanol modification-associated protein YfmH n=1 Tax=Ruminococcus sp. HUN007 TaxID=1514668 RepID=UPI0005D1763C|nr:pitrilysin family protein [Ruminococcus sp. HUN007]
MNKEIITSSITGDSYTRIKHKSGLDILVWEMPGYSSAEALFGTKYGSINTRFRTLNDTGYTTVPEGIAHFLEHKLFENEDCDAFAQYAKTGASANAYTSFDKTCYLFSCTKNFNESLKILLSFVQNPYFTEETVEKEQGIIAQEIRMCNDNPGNRCFYNMLKCLYHEHPVKIDIAGTVDSIKQINADLLYKCYNTFYNLNNMVLVAAGNVNTDEILAIADEKLRMCEDIKLETVFPDEPDTVVQKKITEKMSVGLPVFNIGFKSAPGSGYEVVKNEIVLFTALSVISNAASDFYRKMMADGLINSSFSNEVFSGDGYFSAIAGGESKDPDEVYERLMNEIARVKREGIDRSLFESIRKYTYGSVIKELESPEQAASLLINSYFSGTSAFDGMRAISEMTYDDVMNAINERLDPEKAVLSVIEPQ